MGIHRPGIQDWGLCRERTGLCQAGVVNPVSDSAQLSSVRAQLDELRRRVEGIATEYHETPNGAVAVELFEAERSLVSASRALERAMGTLGGLSSR